MTRKIVAGLGLMLWAGMAQAATVHYAGSLTDGVPVFGDIPTTGANDEPSSTLSDYWSFEGTAGDVITLIGDRLVGEFDMTFWVFEGLFDTDDVFDGSLDSNDPGFVAVADDQNAPFFPGPFGDPEATFTLGATGTYTVIVTNFLSDPAYGGDVFPYRLIMTTAPVAAVPLPAALPVMAGGLGVLGFAGWRRRRA